MKKSIFFAALSIILCTASAQVIVTDTSDFQRVKHFLRFDKTYCSGIHTLQAIFPYMQSNHYQVVENPVVFSGGAVRDNNEGGNKYIGYNLHTAQLRQLDDVFEIGMAFDVATININVNFNAIDTLYPYDTTSIEYLENTGAVTTCILPHHPHIDSVANILWGQSSDIIDYARRCYEYTATHLDYLNANTGLHSLQDIIDNGGGDCGNFSSYYISLLRNRNIPSRHVVAVMGIDNYHVWAEFYLQNYGWIPVDPTFKHGNPAGNYFGHKNSPHYITTLGIELTNYKFAPNAEPMQLALMQLLYWFWWAYDPCTSTNSDFLVERFPTAMVECSSADTTMGHVDGCGRYPLDSTATLTATAHSGYHFTGWSVSPGYTNIITDNPLSLTVSSDITATAHFEVDNVEAIDETESDNINVYLHDGRIVVEGADNEPVSIYNIMGYCIDNNQLAAGVYIVRVGNHAAHKVIVVK